MTFYHINTTIENRKVFRSAISKHANQRKVLRKGCGPPPKSQGHPYFLVPPQPQTHKCLIVFGEFSEATEVTCATTFFSALGCEVRLISPGYGANAPIGLSDHYYHDHNTAKAQLRATHMYTSINSKTVRTTHAFNEKHDDCTILFLPGGSAPDYLQNMPYVVSLVRSFALRRSLIGANCNGTKLLLDVVKGMQLTGPGLVQAQMNQSQNVYMNDMVKVNVVRKKDVRMNKPSSSAANTGCTLVTAGPLYYNFMLAEMKMQASL